MKSSVKEKFNSFIKNRRDLIIEWFYNSNNNQRSICLCNEESIPNENNISILDDYDNTLTRIKNNEFGRCKVCHEAIENEILELDFTSEVCLDHLNEEEKILLEQDLKMAGKVQKLLLPSELPALNGFELSVFMESAGIVGGDYFDFFCNYDNQQGLVVADVMGKGFSASMLMANIQASLRILGPEYKNMNDLVSRLNELFKFNSKLISFVTLFVGKLNTESASLEFCNAGHNPPVLIRAESKNIEYLKPTGPAIGLIKNPVFHSSKVDFQSGDLLLIFTDGLNELKNLNEEEFGQERIESFLRYNYLKSADEFIKALKGEVGDYSKGKFTDDITLMAIKKR